MEMSGDFTVVRELMKSQGNLFILGGCAVFSKLLYRHFLRILLLIKLLCTVFVEYALPFWQQRQYYMFQWCN